MSSYNDFLNEMAGRQWGSLEEARAFMQQHATGYNDQPQAELCGLSPRQADELFRGDWIRTGPLRLNDKLTLEDLSEARFLINARILLSALHEQDGTEATDDGDLNDRFVQSMALKMSWPAPVHELLHSGEWIPVEATFRPMHLLRVIVGSAGLIRRSSSQFLLTRLGTGLRLEEHAGALYAHLFRILFRRFNLAYLDVFEENDALQTTIAMTLYAIGQQGRRWHEPHHLARITLHPLAYERANEDHSVHEQFVWRVLRPLDDFGLIDVRSETPADDPHDDFRVRVRPLFGQFLQFEF